MGKKITVFLLAALLALPLGVLTANAASSMENAKSATVLVGDGDGNDLYGGFIVSVTNSYTYIVTSPGTIGQGDMAVIFYEYLDAGEIVWTDSTGSYILIAVKTTSEITGRFKPSCPFVSGFIFSAEDIGIARGGPSALTST